MIANYDVNKFSFPQNQINFGRKIQNENYLYLQTVERIKF